MAADHLQTPYPLEQKWTRLREELSRAAVPEPTGFTREGYLDIAERIVRAAAPWQDRTGTVIDPYRGDIGGCREIVESYALTKTGLAYAVRFNPPPPGASILIPVIATDGQAESSVCETAHGIDVAYRNARYRIRPRPGVKPELRADPPAANRNALYRTLEIRDSRVTLELISQT